MIPEIEKLIEDLKRYAQSITPVQTGSWQSAHTVEVTDRTAVLYIEPNVVNVRTGDPVISYASTYEEEGGERAIYKRTMEEMDVTDKVSRIVRAEVKGLGNQ